MAGLPRSIIKKYGVSKKAWAVYRGNKTSSKRSNSRGASMARKGSKVRRYAGIAGNKMMNGFYKPSGVVGNIVMGVGAATIAKQIPVGIPYKEEIAAGVVGGLPGAAAVWFMKNRMSGTSSSSNDSDLVSGY